MQTDYMGSGYLIDIWNPERSNKIVALVASLMKHRFSDCGIICCGMSGNLIGYRLWIEHGIKITMARKPGDISSCHGREIEGFRPGRVVFLDDLICGGGTFQFIQEVVRTYPGAELAGVVLWSSPSIASPIPHFYIDAECVREYIPENWCWRKLWTDLEMISSY